MKTNAEFYLSTISHTHHAVPLPCWWVWNMENRRDLPSSFLGSSPSTSWGVFCSGSSSHLGYFTRSFLVRASLWHKIKIGKDAVTFTKHITCSRIAQLTTFSTQWIESSQNWGSEMMSFAPTHPPNAHIHTASPYRPRVPLKGCINTEHPFFVD